MGFRPLRAARVDLVGADRRLVIRFGRVHPDRGLP